MRLNLILAILIFMGGQVFGQVQVGVKTFYAANYGAETSKEFVNVSPLQVLNVAATRATAKKGLGVSIYTDNSKLFLMTDAQYATSGRNFALRSVNYTRTPLDPEVKYLTEETDLRLSATAGAKFGNFKIGVGPEISWSLESTETLSEINHIDTMEKNHSSGFNFLIGYTFFDHIHLDLKHTYMFQDVSNEFTYQGVPLDMRSNLKYLEVSLGLYF